MAVQAFSSDPAFQPGGAIYEALVNDLPPLLTSSTGGAIKYVNTDSHGFLDIAFDATKAPGDVQRHPRHRGRHRLLEAHDLDSKFTTQAFDIAGGITASP